MKAYFQRHAKTLIALGILLVVFVIYKESTSKKFSSSSRQDFVTVRDIFDRIQQGQPLEEDSLASAEKIVKKHKELSPKYDMLLGMAFLGQNNREKGEQYFADAIKRAKKYASPEVQLFNEATLLITQEKFEQAFAKAKELDQKEEIRNSLLHGYNTLRLAFLAAKLNMKDDAEKFVKNLRKHPCYEQIKPEYQQGLCSLDDYLVSSF